mgnify:CR=1 FL=1
MADNDEAGGLVVVGEAGGSGQGGEYPIDSMQASIENDVTKMFDSLFPKICEFAETWMKRGK